MIATNGASFRPRPVRAALSIQIVRPLEARGGTTLFKISNQSVNPGKHLGPYGIPEVAVMALMKQYALDHSHEGIRVNGVNAGGTRSGLMTDQMIADRAAARGTTPMDGGGIATSLR